LKGLINHQKKEEHRRLGRGAARSTGPMKLDGPTSRVRKLSAQQAVKALDKDLVNDLKLGLSLSLHLNPSQTQTSLK
jgi:hypothetical protein